MLKTTFDRSDYSTCSTCPLSHERRVYGGADVANIAKVAFVGEAPGKDESREGSPFAGSSGRLLQEKSSAVGYTWAKTWKTNVITCRPPENKITSIAGAKAINHCSGGFQAELEYLVERGVRVFVALGGGALGAFDVTGNSITKARGSVYPVRLHGHDCFVVPTYHPAWILRGNMREASTWLTDLSRALEISRTGWTWPKENFITSPTMADLEAFDDALNEDTLLAVDIETAGFSNDIIMIGFARDGENALCFPIEGHKSGETKLSSYWGKSYIRASTYPKRWLAQHKCMFQNALYDVPKLRKNGFDVPVLEHDIMLLHHALYSELPHNLGYITSVYGKTPYWKDVRELSTTAAGKVPDEEFRVYNLRDCVVLHQVLPELLDEATNEGVLWAYQQNMSMIPVVEHIQNNGLLLSEGLLRQYARTLTKALVEHERSLRAFGIHAAFNFSSNSQVGYLFYSIKPSAYSKNLAILRESAEKSLRTDTKKYLTAKAYVEAINQTTPVMLPPSFKPPSTTGGGYAVNDDALDIMRRAIRARVAVVEALKTQRPDELAAYERSLAVINTYSALQKTLKQVSNYTDYPDDPDGRVRGSYIIHGTSTGRLACVAEDTILKTDKGTFRVNQLPIWLGCRIKTHTGKMQRIIRRVYKGLDKMYRLTLTSGESITCTAKHRILTPAGWTTVRRLSKGSEVLYVGKQEGLEQQNVGEAYTVPVQEQGETDCSGSREVLWSDISYNHENTTGLLVRQTVQSRKGTSILKIKNGSDECHVWYNWRGASALRRGLRRSPRILDANSQWEEVLYAPDSYGKCHRGRCFPASIECDCPPHRREPVQQQSRQLGSNNPSGAYAATCETIKVSEKTYVGTMGVWDIEVENDSSYIAHGMFHHNSRSPNMQNLPKEAKSVFIPEDGNVFVQADYSNLELRVLAVIANDDVLLEIFNAGKNVHDENTIALFNVDHNHPDWDTLRRAAKTYIFGRNYGGGIAGIYSRVSKQVPDLRLTLAQFKQADQEYRRKHPAYVQWRAEVEREVLETRTLRNAFGRRRVFLGTPSEIKREGLNFPIQSTAADILGTALVGLYNNLPSWCRIVATVHDSIVLEVPAERTKQAVDLLRLHMEQPFTINNEQVVFPVELSSGVNLGYLTDVEQV